MAEVMKIKGLTSWSLCVWAIAYDRLPIKKLIVQRHLGDNSHYPLSSREDESTLHVLRDCEKSKSIWNLLVNPDKWVEFYSPIECISWLDQNLQKKN